MGGSTFWLDKLNEDRDDILCQFAWVLTIPMTFIQTWVFQASPQETYVPHVHSTPVSVESSCAKFPRSPTHLLAVIFIAQDLSQVFIACMSLPHSDVQNNYESL